MLILCLYAIVLVFSTTTAVLLSFFFFSRQIENAGTGIGYRGCTRKLKLNEKDVSLKYPGPDVKEERNVAPNCGKSPCTSIPCLNGAACIVTSANTYRCQCQLGFKGSTCSDRGNFRIVNICCFCCKEICSPKHLQDFHFSVSTSGLVKSIACKS